MAGAGGRGVGYSRAYRAQGNENSFVGVIAFADAGLLMLKERLFCRFLLGRHDGVSQSSEKLIVFDDKKENLRHAAGVDD